MWLDAEDGQKWHLTKNGWSNWDTSDSIIFTGEMKFHNPVTYANKEEYTKGTIQMTGFPAKGTLKVGFRNDSRITYDIVPVPTIMPAQARVAVTDVLLTFGDMQGYYSDVAIAPSAAQKAEDVEMFFSDSSGVANEQLIFYNYIDFATGDKVSAWQLGGVEFGSFYRAMVQDFANSFGFIRNGFSGVIRSFNPLNIAYIEKYSQSKLRLLSGEYNLLTDELSGEWEEVKEQMAEIGDYEITEESNSTNPGTTGGSSSGGGSAGGGGGTSSGITMADVEGAIAPIKDWFVVQELDNGQKILRTKYNLVSDGDVVAGAESDLEINGSEGGGAGLQYAVERTVFPTKLAWEGHEDENYEINEDERNYNIETFRRVWEYGDVFISIFGIAFTQLEGQYNESDDTGTYIFGHLNYLDGYFISVTITVTTDGDAVMKLSTFQANSGGGSEELQDAVIENEEVTAAAFNDVNNRINVLDDRVNSLDKAKEELANAITDLTEEVVTNEQVTAAAFNDVNNRINVLDDRVNSLDKAKEELANAITDLTEEVVTNEQVTAAALADLNARLLEIISRLEALENISN